MLSNRDEQQLLLYGNKIITLINKSGVKFTIQYLAEVTRQIINVLGKDLNIAQANTLEFTVYMLY